MAALSLVSVNIELSRHLELVVPFIRKTRPDVLCVQELMEHDVATLAEACQARAHNFLVLSRMRHEYSGENYGIGIFSVFPATFKTIYYDGPYTPIPEFHVQRPETYNNANRGLLFADVQGPDGVYRIATTHFTWTPDGTANDLQRKHLKSLLTVLEGAGEFVLTGDFNAPRGGEIFDALARRYKDNIPPHCAWSLDLNLHRASNGQIRQHAKNAGFEGFVVDGLFTTPAYRAEHVSLTSGVSDHKAISATIHKTI